MSKRQAARSKFFGFLSEAVSFGSPRAITFNLSAVLLGLALIPSRLVESGPAFCIFKNAAIIATGGACPGSGLFVGCNCPACGLTRGLSSLMHGNIGQANAYNPLTIPVFLVIVALIVMNMRKALAKKP